VRETGKQNETAKHALRNGLSRNRARRGAAQAQPVNLTCTYASGNVGREARVTLDESTGTAVFGEDSVSQAKFTDLAVMWEGTKMKPRNMLYGLVLAAIMLVGIPAQAQNIKFSDTPYSTPVFSATFPAGAEVTCEHTKGDTSDRNRCSAFTSKLGSTEGTAEAGSIALFSLSHSNLGEAKADTKANLDAGIDSVLAHAVTEGQPKTDSTLGGLYAREGSGKKVDDDSGDVSSVYLRLAMQGNRVWFAEVVCDSCTQADADEFFDSIKIK
jgi:hypothetical protein